MKPRNLIIAVLVLAGLGGAIYWAQKHPSSGTAEHAGVRTETGGYLAAQVQNVQITKRDGTSFSIQKQDGKWADHGAAALWCRSGCGLLDAVES